MRVTRLLPLVSALLASSVNAPGEPLHVIITHRATQDIQNLRATLGLTRVAVNSADIIEG